MNLIKKALARSWRFCSSIFPHLQQFSETVVRAAYRRHSKRGLLWVRRLIHSSLNGPQYRVASLPDGLQLKVDITDTREGNLYYGLPVDAAEMKVMASAVRPGDVVFDVGGNIGLYTARLAQAVGTDGLVYTFEPAPATFKILQENIRLNALSNVVAENVAVGEREMLVDFYTTRQSGLAGRSRNTSGTITGKLQVPCITLDAYAERKAIRRVDFLKVDVEGFEMEVLAGARQILERNNRLIALVEINEPIYQGRGTKGEALIEYMKALGYRAWLIDRKNKRIVPGEERHNEARGINYIFARAGYVPPSA